VKVHRITMLVVDHDNIGAGAVRQAVESARYPLGRRSRDAIEPQVLSTETRDVVWSDDHPLSSRSTVAAATARLFGQQPDEQLWADPPALFEYDAGVIVLAEVASVCRRESPSCPGLTECLVVLRSGTEFTVPAAYSNALAHAVRTRHAAGAPVMCMFLDTRPLLVAVDPTPTNEESP
jgi:hypothetical protein